MELGWNLKLVLLDFSMLWKEKNFEVFHYFAATTEQSAVSTRSKAQKINNVTQDAKSVQKVKQSQKKEKPVKNNLEASAKKSSKKESPGTEVTFKNSTKKRTRRKLNLDKGEETENVDQNVDSNESIKILRDRHCDNVTTVKHNLLPLNVSKDLGSEKMANGKLQQRTSVKISPLIVTPKSTPPKLNLTPHRSKKTPKKSPISLGSPKTHSITIPKLFKSPRKLSLITTEDSKENLEKSDSNFDTKISKKSKKNSLNSPTSNRSVSMSPSSKIIKCKKFDINLSVRKFSKSPKIVLKTPKSKKSKSRKLKLLSPSRIKKSALETSLTSPNTTPTLNNVNLSRIRIKKSPLSKGKNLSSIKRRLLNSKLTKLLTVSQIKDVLAEPIVLLERLSPESLKQKNTHTMVASKTRSDTLNKVRSPSIKVESNLEVLVSKKDVSMSTKQNSSPKLRSSSSTKKPQINNSNRISPRIKYNTSTEKNGSSIPLMSSTPQEKKLTGMDTSLLSNASVTSVNNTSLNTRLRHRNRSNIENISEPSLLETYFTESNDSSQSLFSNDTKQNITYDNDDMEKKQKNNRDNTYELEQPQTLSLKRMIKKRTSTDANLTLRDNSKKTKVRFADVASGGDSARKSTNQLNRSRSSISHDANAQNRSNIMNSAYKSKKVETPKLTRNSLISSFKRSSPRIHGGTPKTQLSRLQVTPKTSASIENKSGKTKSLIFHIYFDFILYSNNVGLLIEKKSSMKKKVPNFGRIHEQMFAKSESLVDAKKRLEARHLAFSNLSISNLIFCVHQQFL